MIDKITAGTLYSYGYKLKDSEGRTLTIVGVTDNHIICEVLISGVLWPVYADYSQIGTTYKILARPLEMLTKEIEGKVPLIELAKLALEQKFRYGREYEIENTSFHITDYGVLVRFSEMESWYRFSFDYSPDIERIGFYLVRDNDINYYLNQDALLNFVRENHFNIGFPENTTTDLI